MKIEKVIGVLDAKIENGKHYTLEDLSENLGISKRLLHQAFTKMNTREGWSIRPSNSRPYWRDSPERSNDGGPSNPNRGRAKGEVYHHDYAEPDWSRTIFSVRRP